MTFMIYTALINKPFIKRTVTSSVSNVSRIFWRDYIFVLFIVRLVNKFLFLLLIRYICFDQILNSSGIFRRFLLLKIECIMNNVHA